MRRIALFAVTTVALLVLLFSYRTSRGPGLLAVDPADVQDAGVVVSGQVPDTGAGGSTDPSAGSSTSDGSSSTSGGSSTADKLVVNGSVARTRWGDVQVQVVISGGKITDVTPLQYPTGNSRDRQINAYALPELRSRVLAAQSADIDAVSGATVTSDGYVASLRVALSTAGFTK